MQNWIEEEDIKYSYLYKNNYPAGQSMKCIHLFNLSKDLSCIDLGCGRATLSNYFNSYTGVDISKYIIDINKSTKRGNYFHLSLHELSAIKDYYDIAICSDVMEHIPESQITSVLNSISQLNVKNFYFAISTRKSIYLDHNKKNLHLSIFDASKWKIILMNFFDVLQEEVLATLYTVHCCKN